MISCMTYINVYEIFEAMISIYSYMSYMLLSICSQKYNFMYNE